jgi:hypothetical protein
MIQVAGRTSDLIANLANIAAALKEQFIGYGSVFTW